MLSISRDTKLSPTPSPTTSTSQAFRTSYFLRSHYLEPAAKPSRGVITTLLVLLRRGQFLIHWKRGEGARFFSAGPQSNDLTLQYLIQFHQAIPFASLILLPHRRHWLVQGKEAHQLSQLVNLNRTRDIAQQGRRIHQRSSGRAQGGTRLRGRRRRSQMFLTPKGYEGGPGV